MNFNTCNNVVSLKEVIDNISGYSDVDIREMYLCAQVRGDFSLASKIKKAYNIIKEERIEEFKKTVSDDTCESYLEKHYIDLQKIIIDNRHDILPLGYNQANIDVKNDTIALLHPNNNEKYQLEDKIVFRGHSHQSKQKIDAGGNKILIYVPTCSSIFHNRDYCYPSILDVNFEFSANGLIKEMNISTLIYNNGFIKTNEFQKTFGIIKKALEIKNQL